MHTVRADHLSLYGYERPATPTLQQLAQQGIRFDEARDRTVDARLTRSGAFAIGSAR
jgi:hypothetical protein